jgi:hypothetical protein
MFIPRHPVIENQFCQFTAVTSGTAVSQGAGGVLAYAGSVCYLDDGQTDSTVKIYGANESKVPFGFLMQKVKVGYYSIHPAGMVLPGDLGSSDVIAQSSYDVNGAINGSKPAPVGVAHLGIWDTIHYRYDAAGSAVVINAGQGLKIASASLSELTVGDGNTSQTQDVAIVLKGANSAQVDANVKNTTLYPIRIKLLY